ncbi:MAG: glucokinase [Alphaproteobacteria bacterium]|jgi:glucokinase|nr:glucokinase [Alphaproteobacteria bacterium]
MSRVLLADIGGTHSRFGLAAGTGRPEQVLAFDNDDFPGLDAAISFYLAEVKTRPHAAVLAVAGPVNGHEIALTNRPWRFHLRDLAAQFGLSSIQAINDFEALAWALPRLGPDDTRRLGGGDELGASQGAKLVLGPGTGLGVAALVPSGDSWQSVASEGGHVSFGAESSDEEPVFARLRQHGRVSAETVLSGPGLTRLHAALHPGAAPLPPETIVARAEAGEAAALGTTRLFVRLLGRFAGDVALTFKARGGVYIAGGVACGLGPLFDEDVFREAFESHPPYGWLLAAVPTYLVTCMEPGLIGCAALAEITANGFAER